MQNTNFKITIPSRILVISQMPSLGMKMMTTPLFRSLRNKFQNAKISILTDKYDAGFYKRNPYDIEVHEVPENDSSHLDGIRQISPLIKFCNYDTVISLPLNESIYYYLVSKGKIEIPLRIGSESFLRAYLNDFVSPIPENINFSHDVCPPESIAAPEEYMGKIILRYVAPLWIINESFRPEAWFASEDKEKVDNLFRNIGLLPTDFLFTINLRANQQSNQWKMETLAETIQKISEFWKKFELANRFGSLIFGINYVESYQSVYFKKFMEILKNYKIKSPVFGLPNSNPGELSQIIKRSNYVLTQETGTAHVVEALDKPATVVYPDSRIEKGWKLPESKILSVLSPLEKLSSEDLFFDSLNSLFYWYSKK